MLSLDRILGTRFRQKRLVIKVDVEGAELGVLQGATDALSREEPTVWLVEIYPLAGRSGARNQGYCNTFDTFWSRGYRSVTAAAVRRPVGPQDVAKWWTGEEPPSAENFVFRRE